VVESTGAYSLQRSGAKALPVLVPDLHLGCPSPKSQLAGNDQLLRWASLPARPSDKVVTRVGIATAANLQGQLVKRDNPRLPTSRRDHSGADAWPG